MTKGGSVEEICGTAASSAMTAKKRIAQMKAAAKGGGDIFAGGSGKKERKTKTALERMHDVIANYGDLFYLADDDIHVFEGKRWVKNNDPFERLWSETYGRAMTAAEEKLLRQRFGFNHKQVRDQNRGAFLYYERIGRPMKNTVRWVPFSLDRHEILTGHGIYNGLTGEITDTLEGRVLYGERVWLSPLDITDKDREDAKKVEALLKERMPNDLERERVLELIAINGLAPHARVRNIILAHGDGGTGKSSIMRFLSVIASGGRIAEMSLRSLVTNPHATSALENVLFNISDEASIGSKDIVDKIKELSGGQSCVNPKFRDPRFAAMSVLFILCANRVPELADGSSGIEDRLVPVSIPNKVRGALDNTSMIASEQMRHPLARGLFALLFEKWRAACHKSVEEINLGSLEWREKIREAFAEEIDENLVTFGEILEETGADSDVISSREIMEALRAARGDDAQESLCSRDLAQYIRKKFKKAVYYRASNFRGYKGLKLISK